MASTTTQIRLGDLLEKYRQRKLAPSKNTDVLPPNAREQLVNAAASVDDAREPDSDPEEPLNPLTTDSDFEYLMQTIQSQDRICLELQQRERYFDLLAYAAIAGILIAAYAVAIYLLQPPTWYSVSAICPTFLAGLVAIVWLVNLTSGKRIYSDSRRKSEQRVLSDLTEFARETGQTLADGGYIHRLKWHTHKIQLQRYAI